VIGLEPGNSMSTCTVLCILAEGGPQIITQKELKDLGADDLGDVSLCLPTRLLRDRRTGEFYRSVWGWARALRASDLPLDSSDMHPRSYRSHTDPQHHMQTRAKDRRVRIWASCERVCDLIYTPPRLVAPNSRDSTPITAELRQLASFCVLRRARMDPILLEDRCIDNDREARRVPA
jgi:hypothetical protein